MKVSTTAIPASGVASVAYGTTAGTAAAGNDYRFYGIERIDLRAKYGAPLTGSSHPLSTIGLAAAQALYPNIGLTASTNLSTFEQDTAAWLQAEYDLRTGSNGMPTGGIIGLSNNASMMVSQQLHLQTAQTVWFHGAPGVTLKTLATATASTPVPAIRVSGAYSNAVPLAHLFMLAANTQLYGPNNQGGTAWTGYAGGSQAIAIDNTTESLFLNLRLNGYDQPFAWGDNTYCLNFDLYRADACNSGFNWSQTTGLNSMERIVVSNFTLGNNNYGIDINSTFTDSSNTVQSQGGSFFFISGSIDYNIVYQGRYIGTSASSAYSTNGLNIVACHIETNAATTGSTNCRFLVQGHVQFSNNEFGDQSGGIPGLVQISQNCHASMVNNRINIGGVPLFYGIGTYLPDVAGVGNTYQTVNQRVILLSDGNGLLMQPQAGREITVTYNYDLGFPTSLQGCRQIQMFGTGSFTFQTDATNNGRHYLHTSFLLQNVSGAPLLLQSAAGVSGPQGLVLRNWATVMCITYGANSWSVFATDSDAFPTTGGQMLAVTASSAPEAAHVFKSGSGTLFKLSVTTTGAGYVFVLDQTSAPTSGQTLTPMALTGGALQVSGAGSYEFLIPTPAALNFQTGLTVAFSSTGPTSYTPANATFTATYL